jgi:hypothetical protein
MKYSRWAAANKKIAGHGSEQQETLSMTEKDNVIRALRDIAARNNGEPTEAERRQHAVDVLAKKTPQQRQQRETNPASQALVNSIRGRR